MMADEIVRPTGRNRPGLVKNSALAEAALRDADCATLKRLFDEAQNDTAALADGLAVMAGSTDKIGLRSDAHPDVVLAMRDVALAAIQLARDVAIKATPEAAPDSVGSFQPADSREQT